MIIKIEHECNLNETEITVKCSDKPDKRTQKLINRLRYWDNDIIAYNNLQMHKISLQNVFYIESVDAKTFLYLQQDVYETALKLYELEARLEETPFVRISKSTILNIDKLKSVRLLFGGKMEATMINDEKLIVNRHYLPSFREKFEM